MLTLADINTVTNSYDGDIYSDLYKDVYGFRPRNAQFESVDEFDKDFKYLVNRLNEQNAQEAIEQARNFEDFVCRVEGIQQVVLGCRARERAVQILAESEGFNFYGLESLEYKFNLKYGSIAKWLSEEAE